MKGIYNCSTPSGLFCLAVVTTGCTGGYSLFNPCGVDWIVVLLPPVAPVDIHYSIPSGLVGLLTEYHRFHRRLFIVQPLSGLIEGYYSIGSLYC